MTFEIRSVPDASPIEQEMDEELRAIYDLVTEAVMKTLIIEASPGEVDEWLPDIRRALGAIPIKLQVIAERSGELIHGQEVSA